MEGGFKRVKTQSLECPICLNVFSEPKILSCSHTFCLSCLKRLLDSQHDRKKLPCPVCRKVTDVADGDVGSIQINIALLSLVEDVQSQQQNCTHCVREESPEAVAYCQNCGKYFCDPCHKTHSEWADFSTHTVHSMREVSAGKVVSNKRRKCNKHQQEDEDYFCNDCRKYVCFRCGVMEHERKGHGMLDSAEHEERMKKHIEDLNSKSERKTVTMRRYIELIREQRTKLIEARERLDNHVVMEYKEAIAQLVSKKDVLRNEIEGAFTELEQELDREEEASLLEINNVKAMKELVDNGLKTPLEDEALTAHDTLCENLTEILSRANPNLDKPIDLLRKGENISFQRNIGNNELDLGRLANINTDVSSAYVKSEWLECVSVNLSTVDSMCGMVATPDGGMAIACAPGGVEIRSVNGELQERLLTHMSVYGMGFLTDCRYVVFDSRYDVSLHKSYKLQDNVKFNMDWNSPSSKNYVVSTPHMLTCPANTPPHPSGHRLPQTGIFRPTCTCGMNRINRDDGVCSIAVDGNNHIYVSGSTPRIDRPRSHNPFSPLHLHSTPSQLGFFPRSPSIGAQNRSILIFPPSGGNASGQIFCPANIKPVQIFAMRYQKRLLVKDGDFGIRIIDKSGMIRFSATKDLFTPAFPALHSKDDVIFIAWVRHTAGLVTIERYTSELKYVTTLIANHKIEKSSKRCWYYLQEFTTGELALCTTDRLYIFKQAS